jgi:hypothetical protein
MGKPHFDPRLPRDAWLADSGCTTHIANNLALFRNSTPIEGETITGLADNKVRALGKGTVVLEASKDGKSTTTALHDTLYAPEAVNNLFSISRVDDAGGSSNFANGKVEIRDKQGHVTLQGEKRYRLYWLDAKAKLEVNQVNVADSKGSIEDINSWKSWHKRYGHVSNSTLELLVRKVLELSQPGIMAEV